MSTAYPPRCFITLLPGMRFVSLQREMVEMAEVEVTCKRVLHRRRSLEAAALGTGCRVAVKTPSARVGIAAESGLALGFDRSNRRPGPGPAVDGIGPPCCPAELPGRSRQGPGNFGPQRHPVFCTGAPFSRARLNTHRALAARLSAAADAMVLNVGYRMLPTCGLADAVDDALAGLVLAAPQRIWPESCGDRG